MTKDDRKASFKYSVLQYAQKHNKLILVRYSIYSEPIIKMVYNFL